VSPSSITSNPPSRFIAILLRHAATRHGLSARAHHRVLKVARTLADLAECEGVREEHVGEAVRYRGFALKHG
jgi:magnesium chelatase family protein